MKTSAVSHYDLQKRFFERDEERFKWQQEFAAQNDERADKREAVAVEQYARIAAILERIAAALEKRTKV